MKETIAEFALSLVQGTGLTALAEHVVTALAGVRAYYPTYTYAGMCGLCALYEKSLCWQCGVG